MPTDTEKGASIKSGTYEVSSHDIEKDSDALNSDTIKFSELSEVKSEELVQSVFSAGHATNDEINSVHSKEEDDSLFKLDDNKLQRSLKQRHIQMIALVSVFGTGLFVSSGGALAKTGPVGILLSFLFIGVVVGLNQMALAEVAALAPLSGATIRHSEIFIDEAVGFAYGWLGVWSAIMPSAVVSSTLVIGYWTSLSAAIWITILIVPIILTNIISIRIYGEIEFVFAIL